MRRSLIFVTKDAELQIRGLKGRDGNYVEIEIIKNRNEEANKSSSVLRRNIHERFRWRRKASKTDKHLVKIYERNVFNSKR